MDKVTLQEYLSVTKQSDVPFANSGKAYITPKTAGVLYSTSSSNVSLPIQNLLFSEMVSGNISLNSSDNTLSLAWPDADLSEALYVSGNSFIAGNLYLSAASSGANVSIGSSYGAPLGSMSILSYGFSSNAQTGLSGAGNGVLYWLVQGNLLAEWNGGMWKTLGATNLITHLEQSNARLGLGALNGGENGSHNTGLGSQSLSSLSTGFENVAIGSTVLTSLSSEQQVTALGYQCMQSATGTTQGVALGHQASLNYKGPIFTSVGLGALKGSGTTSTTLNTAVGVLAANSVTTSNDSLFLGYRAGANVTTGDYNVLLGSDSAPAITTRTKVVSLGYGSLLTANEHYNTSIGSFAFSFSTQGQYGSVLGAEAASGNNLGDHACALGYQALLNQYGNTGAAMGARAIPSADNDSQHAAFGAFAGENVESSLMTVGGARALSERPWSDRVIALGAYAASGENRDEGIYLGHRAAFSAYGGSGGNRRSIFIGSEVALNQVRATNAVVIGYRAAADGSTTSASSFVALGAESALNIDSANSLAIGYQALKVTTSDYHTVVGYRAGANIGNSNDGVALGYKSMEGADAQDKATALGSESLQFLTSSGKGVALGYRTARHEQGLHNVAAGSRAMEHKTTGNENVVLGAFAANSPSGSTLAQSVVMGYQAAQQLGGTEHIIIGSNTVTLNASQSNVMVIGSQLEPDGTADGSINIGGALFGDMLTSRVAIGGNVYSRDVDTSTQSLYVHGDAARLSGPGAWDGLSDRRVKTDIKTLTDSRSVIMALRPVSFRYKRDHLERHPEIVDRPYLGFIAQELEQVCPNAISISPQKAPDGTALLMVDPYETKIHWIRHLQEMDGELSDIKVAHREIRDLQEETSLAAHRSASLLDRLERLLP